MLSIEHSDDAQLSSLTRDCKRILKGHTVDIIHLRELKKLLNLKKIKLLG